MKQFAGIGTMSDKEIRECFRKIERHRITLKYRGKDDDKSIMLAFSKKKLAERKEWLKEWMEERQRMVDLGHSEQSLPRNKAIAIQDFVNKELVLFSNMDNVRSIPSLVDGFKPDQRKVFFAFLNLDQEEVKVVHLVGATTMKTDYRHGSDLLAGVVIGLAQNFVGSNNINILTPSGQFGTRLAGGKDAASSRFPFVNQLFQISFLCRHIFTSLSPLTKMIFNSKDFCHLTFNNNDDTHAEPQW